MKNTLRHFLLSLSLGLGTVLLLSPFGLYWWIHGDYNRYVWIINGPYPYSNLGGTPFQLALYAGLLLSGIVFIVIYFIGQKYSSKATSDTKPM